MINSGCNTNHKSEQNEGNSKSDTTERLSNDARKNQKTEKYFDVGDAKIYYEVYGKGTPILLLHGGLYGSIAEFNTLIPELQRNYKVIAISTRGHGKSEIGKKKFSYRLFAEDALAILKNENEEKA